MRALSLLLTVLALTAQVQARAVKATATVQAQVRTVQAVLKRLSSYPKPTWGRRNWFSVVGPAKRPRWVRITTGQLMKTLKEVVDEYGRKR